jgi:hypothetical protein
MTAAAPALLHALHDLLRGRGVDRLPTEAVVAALGERLGGPITATWLARTLGPYGVAPRQFRMPGSGRRAWGYCLSDLAEGPAAGLSGESCDAAAEWATRIAMAAMVR